jgi:hypothetical protein
MDNLKKMVLVFLVMMAASCAEEEVIVQENPPVDSLPANPLITTHFTFHYTPWDSATIVAIGDSLEVHYQRITGDLSSGDLPMVHVHFYTSYDSLADAVSAVVPNLPSWAIGLATAEDQIHMLSPNDPNYDFQYMFTNIVHEFAHCVSWHMNSSIGNNPRWLWESVAIFEAGQFVDPHNISYLVNQDPPTISELNSMSNTYVYDVGFLIGEYITETWDYAHLRDLINNNGNLQTTLGMTSSEFQSAWFQFVKDKYGI